MGERRRSWVALGVIFGLLGGLVLAATAAGRRTDDAYPRFLASQRAYDKFLFVCCTYPGDTSPPVERVRALPEVETLIEGRVYDGEPGLVMRGSLDARLDRSLNAVNVLAGRLPGIDAADEILITPSLAAKRGLGVGDALTFTMRPPEREPVTVRATVVGIGISPGEFPPENDIGLTEWVHLSPAFVRAHPFGGAFAYVFLRRGEADLASFQRGLSSLSGGAPVIGYEQASLTKNVRRAFHLQAVALWLLAAMLAIATVALMGQSIARMTWLDARDHEVLRAVGMTRPQLVALALIRTAGAGAVAALVAAGVAFSLSPLAPTGRARQAVPDPGISFDVVAVGGGALGILASAVVLALLPAWRASRATEISARMDGRPSATADALARAGASVTATTGVRLALERGRGRTSVPTRPTMVGAVLAVAAIAMTLTFGDSLRHLLRTPRLYGATYDLVGRARDVPVPRERVPEVLGRVRSVPEVAMAAEAAVGMPFRVDGELADALAIDDRAFLPPLIEGRYPRTGDEIVLGPNTLRRIGKRVGDTVELSVLGAAATPLRVVGVAVIPTAGHSANLGEGSLVGLAAFGRAFGGDSMADVVIRLKPGADAAAAVDAVMRATGGALTETFAAQQPGDLVNFGGQRDLPFVLATILVTLAGLTIVHALVSTIVRRRRDLAILTAIGFTPRQTRRTIAWQATTLVVAGLVAGLPLGVASGRWSWTAYAHTLGIIAEPRTPFAMLALAVPSLVVLGLLASVVPARRAARLEPALALRTE